MPAAAQVEMAKKAAKLKAKNSKTNRSLDRFLSKTEVCDRVGKTYPTLWMWMREGKFPLAFPERHPTGKTRQPFRRCIVPSTTCDTHTPPSLPCNGDAPPGLLLRSRSPTRAFEAPG